MIPRAGAQGTCAPIFWNAPLGAASAPLKSWLPAYGLSCGISASRADLDKAVPAFTSWRLADLPKYLTAEQVDRLIAGCDGGSPERRRDRAIIMLLARLGLRAGDVARLCIADIEW